PMTVRRTLLLVLFVVTCLFGPQLGHADERIWLDGKINGTRVHLAFDTGSSDFALFSGAFERLGLKFISDPTNDYPSGVLAGFTEKCDVKVAGARGKTQFHVLEQPAYAFPDCAGFIGWNFFL